MGARRATKYGGLWLLLMNLEPVKQFRVAQEDLMGLQLPEVL